MSQAIDHPSLPFHKVPKDNAAVIHHHSRSFAFASRLLPAHVRSDVQKLYAWCRWCDDAVDSTSSPAEARRRIGALRRDIERIYEGEPTEHEASKWLADLVRKHSIRQEYPSALLDGMAFDIRLIQIENRGDLLAYCQRAAGVVGLMLCQIFGVDDQSACKHATAQAREHAMALGIAMQLTNIARDVLEDSMRGRCYLPKSWLPKGIHSSSDREIRQEVEQILGLADEYYDKAHRGMHFLPRSIRPAIRIAAAIYREIGMEVQRRDCLVMNGRIITPLARFLIAAFFGLTGGVVHDLRRWAANRIRPSRQADYSYPFVYHSEIAMNDAKYVGWLGISLTALMGGALFLLVMFNPKDPSYSFLPLVYAVACFVVGAIANVLAKRNETPQPVRVTVDNDHRRR